MRGFLVAAGSLVFSVAAAIVAWQFAVFAAGPDVSDLGVSMYAGGARALLCGIILYGVIVLAALALVGAVAASARKKIWIVGGAVAALTFLPFAWLLLFSFG